MNKSLKAVLLSALVYPGAGHFVLKKYSTSTVLAGIFSVPLFLVISDIVARANQVVEQIKNGDIPLDIAAISESILKLSAEPDAQELNIKIYVMVIVWIVAMLDAYRVSKQKT